MTNKTYNKHTLLWAGYRWEANDPRCGNWASWSRWLHSKPECHKPPHVKGIFPIKLYHPNYTKLIVS